MQINFGKRPRSGYGVLPEQSDIAFTIMTASASTGGTGTSILYLACRVEGGASIGRFITIRFGTDGSNNQWIDGELRKLEELCNALGSAEIIGDTAGYEGKQFVGDIVIIKNKDGSKDNGIGNYKPMPQQQTQGY